MRITTFNDWTTDVYGSRLIGNTNSGTTTVPCVWTNSKQKRNQVTSHLNWPWVLLYAPNDIIKGCLHCLKSESKGRFLVNNTLMFGSAWCLVIGGNPIFFNKKINIGRPEHSLTPHPLHPITSHFCLTPPHPHPPPPSRWASYV